MADHVVHRGADGLRKALVIERRRNRLLFTGDVIVADLVQFTGGNARLDVFADHLQHRAGHLAGDAHGFDVLRRFQNDAVIAGFEHFERALLAIHWQFSIVPCARENRLPRGSPDDHGFTVKAPQWVQF